MSAIDTLPFTSEGSADATLAVEAAVRLIAEGGVAIVPQALAGVRASGIASGDAAMMPVLIETVAAFLEAFDADGRSPDAYRALKAIDADAATAASDLLLLANFPDGEPILEELSDGAVLALTGFVSAAGRHADALEFADLAATSRDLPGLDHAIFVAQCRARGCSHSIADYWPDDAGTTRSVADAQFLTQLSPLDPAAHQALARRLLKAGNGAAALEALAVALVLPLAEPAKLMLADDLARIIAFLFASGDEALLDSTRFGWALGSCPTVAAATVQILRDLHRARTLPFLALDAAARADLFLSDFVAPAAGKRAALSPYPLRDGKPHVDVVWLEITNFCNQKCGFCPDMHREDARTWLPLAEVKRLIDELAETVSVGSMQLNAYGEPLLHPNIAEILGYIREKQLPWPTFFTSHGMTLVEKKLKQLSHNYPAGIAISLHNDSQDSYAATRSAKIGDYETLVARVTDLLRQMAYERAPSHLRLYQMVCNGNEDWQVDPKVRGAFPDSPERMAAHIRSWERIAAEIAATAPEGVLIQAMTNSDATIAQAFREATHADGVHLPILHWADVDGRWQTAFMSPRPVGTYANLLLEYHPDWEVKRQVVNLYSCSFTATPSLAIFATGRLGICCLDLNSTATFGALSDYPSLADALASPEALRMFAQVSNGVATSAGCQICLGTGKQLCGS